MRGLLVLAGLVWAGAAAAAAAADPTSVAKGDLAQSQSPQLNNRTTKMEFDVDTRGRVTACRILQSSGDAELDANACALTRTQGFVKRAMRQPTQTRSPQPPMATSTD